LKESAKKEGLMTIKNILFTNALTESQMASLRERLATSDYNLIVADGENQLKKELREAHILIVKDHDMSAELLNAASSLQLIVIMKPGKGNVDLKASGKLRIPIETICSPALLGVAEHTILLMLSLIKSLPKVDYKTKHNLYPGDIKPKITSQREYTFNWSSVHGMDVLYRHTLGLVGLGTIGRLVAERAKAFQMEVLYYDPCQLEAEDEKKLGVEFVSFDKLLELADFVSLHTRVTRETEKMISEGELKKMKNSAYLINTARGRLVDEDALYKALINGQIAGAGLDVFWKEPPEQDNPLLSLENVVLTSHCAGIYNDDAQNMEVDFLVDILSK
jgi:phosphoglycerate dehydrogenase-like enzyme